MWFNGTSQYTAQGKKAEIEEKWHYRHECPVRPQNQWIPSSSGLDGANYIILLYWYGWHSSEMFLECHAVLPWRFLRSWFCRCWVAILFRRRHMHKAGQLQTKNSGGGRMPQRRSRRPRHNGLAHFLPFSLMWCAAVGIFASEARSTLPGKNENRQGHTTATCCSPCPITLPPHWMASGQGRWYLLGLGRWIQGLRDKISVKVDGHGQFAMEQVRPLMRGARGKTRMAVSLSI